MSASKVMLKDKDGFKYKHPERSCKRCINYPCISNMDKLQSDFAKYGCENWKDGNIFDTCSSQK